MTLRFSAFAFATAAAACVAHAQTPVQWKATPPSEAVARGATAPVKLVATIDAGWHIYSLTQGPGGPTPTKITLPKDQPFTIGGEIKATAPDVKLDQNFGINVETYVDDAEFTVPVKVDPAAKVGDKVLVAVRYQVCNESTCLPPHTEKISVPLTIKKGK